MPIDLTGSPYRRLAGTREFLLEEARAYATAIDPRGLLECANAQECAAEKARLEAEASVHPRRTTLFDKLERGEPVVIPLDLLYRRLPPDAPPWLREHDGCVRVYHDDVVEPADGPADC